jgi:hypothetical protein
VKTNLEEINDTLWSLGWQFGVTCFLAIVFAGTSIYALDSFFGMAASLVIIIPWYRGTRLININWNDVFAATLKKVQEAGAKQLNLNSDETDIFQLMYSSGSAFGIIPKRRYHMSLIYLGENSLSIYDNAGIDMVNREFIRGSNTKVLDYLNISSVDFLSPYLMIQTSSGDKLSYRSSDTYAVPALKAIQNKLHSVQES